MCMGWGGGRGEGSVTQVGVCVCAWVRKVCARVCMPMCESIHFFTPFFFSSSSFFPFVAPFFVTIINAALRISSWAEVGSYSTDLALHLHRA